VDQLAQFVAELVLPVGQGGEVIVQVSSVGGISAFLNTGA
jgi:hypothetical protein